MAAGSPCWREPTHHQLTKLDRTCSFRRTAPVLLTVRDAVSFSRPQSFETALITWGKWQKISEREILVRDGDSQVRVTIETGGLPFDLRSKTLDEDVRTKTKPARIGIALKSPVGTATVTLTMTPGP